MNYRVIGDSCCDFTKEELTSGHAVSVPMSVIIGGVEYPDDGKRTQAEWIKLIKEDEGYPQSACPSPDAFYQSFDASSVNFVVTISSKLSGVYNSAMLAKEMFEEEHEGVQIHVFDSYSAAAGEHQIYEKVVELAEAGRNFEEIVAEVEDYRDQMTTIFVLDDLETFKRNGRLKGIKALVATTMNIKPVLIGDDGVIKQIDQAIGMNRAVNRMLYHVEKKDPDITRRVRITQCDSKKLCTKVARVFKERFGFTDVEILDAQGLSTSYENPGGIIIAY
ncbi:MAG: DegV family protein [Lachnospiraceae bacterium]|nr:DegV family protein [Lachnospiraceae bacterium]MCR4684526.1 DegV family protein [Lachnospiraceae bacterium]